MLRLGINILIALLFSAVISTTASALDKPKTHQANGPVTGLAMPRFVSLRAEEANLRAGPGFKYPKVRIFGQRHLPVIIIDEFDHWRKVRDWDGEEGWLHKRLLIGTRYLRIEQDEVLLHSKPVVDARAKARMERGALAKMIECKSDWCRVQAQSFSGWVKRSQVFGVFNTEFKAN